jgi:ATP-dependent Clp protease ATP-binding subunit ClpB
MSARQKLSKLSKTSAFLILFSFILTNTFAAQTYLSSQVSAAKQFASQYPALAKYATDLTKLARDGKVSLNADLEREADLLVKFLSSDQSRQTVILDETGEAQEAVVKILASRIAKKEVPASLSGKRVLMLEIGKFFEDVKDNAEASKRVEAVLNDLAKAKGEIILFVNELTNFAGRSEISGKLAESIAQGKARIIGGSSKAAYSEKIEPLEDVAALFVPLYVGDRGVMEETAGKTAGTRNFKGDNVSPDLREMIANDTTGGTKRVDVIVQAKKEGSSRRCAPS